MKTALSQNMRRYNYLMSETGAVYHAASVKLGISDSVLQILYAVCDSGDGCIPVDICRLTGLTKQTVNSSLRNLERDGIIGFIAVNAKSKKVVLTEKGVLLSESTVAKIIKAENDVFDSWSDEEVRQYLSLTERYLVALKEKVKAL
ncbi:MAG: MarR family transcriptional regulator [Oscillospiraceae bacterium]|nr:MarR family transcriptional regulator [Oscillospiraceae bacterium]